jgi:hypothetical protein
MTYITITRDRYEPTLYIVEDQYGHELFRGTQEACKRFVAYIRHRPK